MKTEDTDNKLDSVIRTAIGREDVPFDFGQWRHGHRAAIEQFQAQCVSGESLNSSQMSLLRRLRWSPVFRFAVAAVVVLVAVWAVSHLGSPFDVAPAYAFTDAPEVLARAATIHASGWRYFPGHTMPDGSAIPPVPIELWVDLVNGCERQTTTGLSAGKDYVHVGVGELIQNSQFMFRLDHTEKTSFFFPRGIQAGAEGLVDRSVRLLLGDFAALASAVKVGDEEIDGQECEIWQWQRDSQVAGPAFRTRFWFSPATGRTKRVESWMKWGPADWQLAQEYTRIELDLPLGEGIFAMETPVGYTAMNTPEAAALPPSRPFNLGGYSDGRCSLSYGAARSFTLADGSVIWGWWSIDKMSQTPREAPFADLVFGGPLPKVPIEFNALVPGGEPSDVTYWGHHLTYTSKSYTDGGLILTEWVLYVPDETPAETVEEYDYDALYVFNLDHTPHLKISLPVPYGRRIGTAEDFDRWVLPAIGETSDDGQVPAGLTFDRVLQLAEQIREAHAREKGIERP
ncbi:MAG: hypothetical protein JW993_16115 [Sedimentisphaerales bacterium]|nr:hypothetical protein [Sedimentisphaerales bacterium]